MHASVATFKVRPGKTEEAVRIYLGSVVPVVVRMLGGFSISVGSRIVEEGGWRLKKAVSLLKLLALAKEHRMHRERAMEMLWPNLEPEAAANNLHQSLYVARRTLDSTASSRYLRLRDEQLELCPEGRLWVDVEAFEEVATAARHARDPAAYQTALDLYAGDLLPQDPYEHWTEDCREERKTRTTSWTCFRVSWTSPWW